MFSEDDFIVQTVLKEATEGCSIRMNITFVLQNRLRQKRKVGKVAQNSRMVPGEAQTETTKMSRQSASAQDTDTETKRATSSSASGINDLKNSSTKEIEPLLME